MPEAKWSKMRALQLQATARGLAPSSVGARRSSARVTNFILIYYFLIIINFVLKFFNSCYKTHALKCYLFHPKFSKTPVRASKTPKKVSLAASFRPSINKLSPPGIRFGVVGNPTCRRSCVAKLKNWEFVSLIGNRRVGIFPPKSNQI